MPVIEGYNEQETGSGYKEFAVGKHDVTITGAKYETGEKNGNGWQALVVSVDDGIGTDANTMIAIPRDTSEWLSWSNGRRKATKGQLDALGIDMSVVEDDQARGLLIGKQIEIDVKVNGEYKNTYFQKPAATVSGLPGPASVATVAASSPVVF